ncbi:MAG: DUF2062 domain-containing protein [Nanoarchaeota archaeon]|nr:DUF2062 domain-containing protein [Nanoarchaeota archaeon]
MKKLIKKYYEKLKQHVIDVLKIKKSPHSIAMGFAVGTFLEIIPLPGITFLVGLLIVFIFKKINKISMLLAFLFWNILLTGPLYILAFQIGNMLFEPGNVVFFHYQFLDIAYNFARRVVVGAAIIGFFVAVISYFGMFYIIKWYQKKYPPVEDEFSIVD